MIKIINNVIPFKGFSAMTIWPFLFCRKEPTPSTINHENIHARQQLECLLIPFYLIYFVEWIFKGYKNISFEKEAYSNQSNKDYLHSRKLFNMWRK